MTRDDDLVFDVEGYLAERQANKPPLSYADFLASTDNYQLFLIEYFIGDEGEQEIVWARRQPQQSEPDVLILHNARIFDDTEINKIERERTSIQKIPLCDIIALRINHKRYNWRYELMTFEQE